MHTESKIRFGVVLSVVFTGMMLFTLIACESEEDAPFIVDEFRGIYEAGDPFIVGSLKTDSVHLKFDQPEHYVIEHYDSIGQVIFCNSEGVVIGRGSPTLDFYPDTITSINCDRVRGVAGRTFDVRFGATDSLWLDYVNDPPDDSVFRFRLYRVR